MAGAARLFCESCTRDTYWFYSQHSEGASTAGRTAQPPARIKASNGAVEVSASSSGEAAGSPQTPMRIMQAERRIGTDRRHRARRTQRRVALQVPVRLRVNSPASQFEEITRTVNVCRNGIYIQSERPYTRGAPLYVAMNYSPKETGILSEQKATVVRVDSTAGTPARGVAIQLH
ncbi:MAG: hypothetical protein HYX73_10120 [Acidobacteria bacterium]|nr:hypothetical protein [Acidobacteriota bacterium]